MPYIEIGESGLIDVQSTFTEGPLVKAVPGSRYSKDHGWRIPLSWPAFARSPRKPRDIRIHE